MFQAAGLELCPDDVVLDVAVDRGQRLAPDHSSQAVHFGDPGLVSVARGCSSFRQTAELVAPPPLAVLHPS